MFWANFDIVNTLYMAIKRYTVKKPPKFRRIYHRWTSIVKLNLIVAWILIAVVFLFQNIITIILTITIIQTIAGEFHVSNGFPLLRGCPIYHRGCPVILTVTIVLNIRVK